MPSQPEVAVTAPFTCVVVAIEHEPGGEVDAGAALIVIEAMKMEHEILADTGGILRSVEVAVGDSVQAGETRRRGCSGLRAEHPVPQLPCKLHAGRHHSPSAGGGLTTRSPPSARRG